MKPEANNEVQKFFEGLPSEDKQPQDIFDDKPKAEPTEQTVPEKDEEVHKNRRHRRLEQQLQQEKEARIAAEARAQALSESGRFAKEVEAIDDVSEKWLRIYGDTPETRLAWKLNEELLSDKVARMKEDTLKEIEAREQAAIQEQQQYESQIDAGTGSYRRRVQC